MLRKKSQLFMLSALLAAGITAHAAAPDLAVQQIIDRNVAARGGAAAWRAVKALSMTGTMDVGSVLPDPSTYVVDPRKAASPRNRLHPDVTRSPDAEAQKVTLPFQMDLKRPRMMRVELKVKDSTAVQVYDGSRGWKLRPYIGRHEVEPYSPVELSIAAGQQELDGPLIDYAAKGTKVEKAGVETVGGHDAYKLRLTLKGGQVRYVWIDATTFLDVKIDSGRQVGKKVVREATLMSDFRTVDGLKIPFLLENMTDGSRASQRLMVAQVAVNPSLPDNRFTKPE